MARDLSIFRAIRWGLLAAAALPASGRGEEGRPFGGAALEKGRFLLAGNPEGGELTLRAPNRFTGEDQVFTAPTQAGEDLSAVCDRIVAEIEEGAWWKETPGRHRVFRASREKDRPEFVLWEAMGLPALESAPAPAGPPRASTTDPGLSIRVVSLPPAGTAPPSPADLAERIARRIRELDDDDYQVREHATADLLSIGAPALDPLRKFLGGEPGLEAKTRAEEVVAKVEERLRWKGIQGGEAVNGLQATLRSDRPAGREGAPVKFELEIKNVGKEARRFVPVQEWDHERTEPGARTETSVNTSQARIVLRKTRGERAIMDIAISSSVVLGGGARFPEQTLQPGEAWKGPVELKGMEPLTAGTYEIEVVYYAKSRRLAPGATGDLKSNTIRLEVAPREEEIPEE